MTTKLVDYLIFFPFCTKCQLFQILSTDDPAFSYIEKIEAIKREYPQTTHFITPASFYTHTSSLLFLQMNSPKLLTKPKPSLYAQVPALLVSSRALLQPLASLLHHPLFLLATESFLFINRYTTISSHLKYKNKTFLFYLI